MNERAVYYRKMERIADDLGTAVNVQTMVFGNKGDTSATGVGFTRNPADGTKEYYGDFLTNAQGEDVVAGIRITEPIADLKTVPGLEAAGVELDDVFDKLEASYRDMCDIEFTIEQGKLWMLQTRIGKRTARAALKIAIDMVDEGMIDAKEAVLRIDPAQLDQLLHPQFDQSVKYDVLAKGLNASPGAAVGEVVFSSADAVAAKAEGRKVILVRWETNPDDLPGMDAAQGILTSPRRQDEPRGRRRARHGQAVRLRRREAQDRRRAQGRPRRRRRAPRGRHHLDRRHDRRRRRRRRLARRAGGHRRLRQDPRHGPTSTARWACAPTPTPPTTQRSAASSARRASACAAPSTCSSASGR